MSYNIFIDDLVVNAFIITLDYNKRFLTYEEIEDYGREVIQYLNNLNINVNLILSKTKTDAFLIRYSHFFERKDILGIALKENVTKEDLINEFRGHLSLNLLLDSINDKKLNNNYESKDKTLIYKDKNE